ncbi:hypothetical protein ACFL1I_01745 [Candidatus Omnitrophota bacterium]
MFFANLSQRERRLIQLTLAVISLTVVYSFIVRPLAANWQELNRQILEQEIELKSNIRYISQKEQVRDIYRQLAGVIQKGGVDEEEVTALLRFVEKTAKDSTLHISNIRPKPIKDLVFCKKYILEMNCQATMEGYIKFIYTLQQSEQLIRVENLRITAAKSSSPQLKARLIISKILASQ